MAQVAKAALIERIENVIDNMIAALECVELDEYTHADRQWRQALNEVGRIKLNLSLLSKTKEDVM
ncbi:hypothetical protein A4G20_05545 [Pasteurellaceae bacterium RH1A]|nr:hypothetical protein A4G20_05545 [Pasteurellaceae bacterium RH1A]